MKDTYDSIIKELQAVVKRIQTLGKNIQILKKAAYSKRDEIKYKKISKRIKEM